MRLLVSLSNLNTQQRIAQIRSHFKSLDEGKGAVLKSSCYAHAAGFIKDHLDNYGELHYMFLSPKSGLQSDTPFHMIVVDNKETRIMADSLQKKRLTWNKVADPFIYQLGNNPEKLFILHRGNVEELMDY